MNIGDLVRRQVERNGVRLHSYVGVIIEELRESPGGHTYTVPVFQIFWGERRGAFAISEDKLELLSENR